MAAQQQAAAIRAAAKLGEPDRYLTALLAPTDKRDGLIALAAFGSEVARIPHIATDPMMQRIRLQWWRDALSEGATTGELSGHPIADSLSACIRTFGLPIDQLTRILDVWEDTFEDPETNHADDVCNDFPARPGIALFSLSARICGAADNEHLTELATRSGQAYERARSLLMASGPPSDQDASFQNSRTLCLQHLAAARAILTQFPRQQRLAFLPLAMVTPYLHARQSSRASDHGDHPKVLPLSRIWRIWWAYCTGQP